MYVYIYIYTYHSLQHCQTLDLGFRVSGCSEPEPFRVSKGRSAQLMPTSVRTLNPRSPICRGPASRLKRRVHLKPRAFIPSSTCTAAIPECLKIRDPKTELPCIPSRPDPSF